MRVYPKLVIDMHTHLFNARYVPLNKIMRSRKIPPGISNLLSRLILTLTQKSRYTKAASFAAIDNHSCPTEQLIDRMSDIVVEQYSDLVAQSLESIAKQSIAFSEAVYEVKTDLDDSDFYQVLLDINNEFGDQDSSSELSIERIAPSFSKQLEKDNAQMDKSLVKGWFGGLRKMLRKLIKKALRFVENTADTLDFFYTMMRSEKSILRRLTNYYDRVDDFLLVHHMMDMKYPFDGKVRYSYYKKQLPNMTRLERYSNGEAIGFSAFDPWRFVKTKASKKKIRKHLKKSLEQGKVGFKFYPPMNYKAAGNDKGDDGQPRLEKVIDIFFDYCVENKVPVFTHCTPEGFEVVPGKTGHNAHPKYWRKALTKYSARNDLILCFGHAGGGQRVTSGQVVRGWLSATDDEWKHDDNYAAYVVDLCREFPNVYCEISYMHEIIDDPQEKINLQYRIATEFNKPAEEGQQYLLQDKIMYGTDWHMPSMVNDINKYLDFMVDIFEDDKLKAYKNAFFANNAVKYLGLEQFIERADSQLNADCAAELKRKLLLTQT